MNIKILLIFLAMAILGHAEPKKSFLYLEKTSRLEYALNSSAKYYMLGSIFPHKGFLENEALRSRSVFDQTIRQVNFELKKSDNSKILRYFIEAKNLLDNNNENISTKKMSKLVELKRSIQRELKDIVDKKIMALSPRQKIIFSIDNSMQIAVDIFLEYAYMQAGKQKNKNSSNYLKSAISSFDKELSTLLRYRYWNVKEKDILKRIRHSWKNLRGVLAENAMYMVVDIGSEHIESLLRQLKASYTTKKQG